MFSFPCIGMDPDHDCKNPSGKRLITQERQDLEPSVASHYIRKLLDLQSEGDRLKQNPIYKGWSFLRIGVTCFFSPEAAMYQAGVLILKPLIPYLPDGVAGGLDDLITQFGMYSVSQNPRAYAAQKILGDLSLFLMGTTSYPDEIKALLYGVAESVGFHGRDIIHSAKRGFDALEAKNSSNPSAIHNREGLFCAAQEIPNAQRTCFADGRRELLVQNRDLCPSFPYLMHCLKMECSLSENQSPSNLPQVSARLNKETRLEPFIDLSDPDILKKYVAKPYRNPEDLQKFINIGKGLYEIKTHRNIGEAGKYGIEFPMNPEVLAYAMNLATNASSILEIAGARGENTILLGFSDAKRIYYNEIDPTEITGFRRLTKSLPKSIYRKLEIIPGDCFQILKKKPKLLNKIDLILNRNLIHFFNDQQQEDFFNLLKKMLKPGGVGIFTVNSVYSKPKHLELLKDYPDATCFYQENLYLGNPAPLAALLEDISVIKPDGDLLKYNNTILYQFTKDKWQELRDGFQKLSPQKQHRIRTVFKDTIYSTLQLENFLIWLSQTTVRSYNERNLRNLLSQQGFEVLETFATSETGHLENLSNPKAPIGQIGIIVKKPS